MKNKKRLFVKLIIVVIGLLLMVKAYDMMKVEEVFVEEKPQVVYDVPQSDIITSGQETIIKTFDQILSIQWVSDHELFIEGVIDGVIGNYSFDTNKQVLKVYSSELSNESPLGETFVASISDGKDLLVENGSLILKTPTEEKIIIGNMMYGENALFELSDDNSKLLFYNTDKNSLVTYNFEKDFYRTIYNDVTQSVLEDFYRLVKLSPLGGYVAIESRSDELLEHNFSIYGADSGNLYAKDVHGVDVAWSKDDKYLTYYYTKESETINSDSNYLKSKRMAYYDVDRKEIQFIDSTPTEFSMLSDIYWYGDQVSVLIGSADESLNVNGLWIYDFASDMFKEIPLSLDNLALDTVFDFIVADDMLFIIIDSPLDHRVVRINMTTHERDMFDNLKPFDVNGKESVFYYHNKESLLTFDDEKLTLSHGKKEGYAYIEHEVFKVYPNPNLQGFAVLLPQKNIIKLLKIN